MMVYLFLAEVTIACANVMARNETTFSNSTYHHKILTFQGTASYLPSPLQSRLYPLELILTHLPRLTMDC